MTKIPFNRPFLTGNEIKNIADAHERNQLSGDGHYTKLCNEWLEKNLNTKKALITHSCTAALELSAIAIDISPGDEVIMPSYTFVSTANAFVIRGAKPVFVDVNLDDLTIDVSKIEPAITNKTKAIVVVHYAGISAKMDEILEIAKKYNLFLIEDAAQAILSKYKSDYLGTIGDLGCLSFHETKNVVCGEGGAILVNNENLIEKVIIAREKGTNRSNFLAGKVDKYTWVDVGSSYLPGEIVAAFLLAQLESAETIISKRKSYNKLYQDFFLEYKNMKDFNIPNESIITDSNGHTYYLIFNDIEKRNLFISECNKEGLNCTFHYVPLHSSIAGEKFGSISGTLHNTDYISNGLVRLPVWIGIEREIDVIFGILKKVIKNNFN